VWRGATDEVAPAGEVEPVGRDKPLVLFLVAPGGRLLPLEEQREGGAVDQVVNA